MRQTNFSPRNISANQVERVVPNALQDFRCGPSGLRASRSPFHCIDPAKRPTEPAVDLQEKHQSPGLPHTRLSLCFNDNRP